MSQGGGERRVVKVMQHSIIPLGTIGRTGGEREKDMPVICHWGKKAVGVFPKEGM